MELADALAYATDRHHGILVTLKADGRPQLSNITYLVRDGVARISMTADRAKYKNLMRNPAVSLYVGQDDFWGYAVFEGDAEFTPVATDTGDATVGALVELYREIQGEHPDWDDYRRAMVTDRRVVCSIRPTRAYGMIPT